jgi:putative FmdB family regulatory protein
MPIYIYECKDCCFRFERFQRMADDPLTDCPQCGGHVRRIIQPVGIIFRGSGFYVTDNRQVSSPTLKAAKDSDKSSAPAEGAAEPSKEPITPDKESKKEPSTPDKDS